MKKYFLVLLLLFSGAVAWTAGADETDAGEISISDVTGGRYRLYSPEEWNRFSDRKRVLFFHASWCPTCRGAESDLLENYAELDSDTVVFRIDYDTAAEMKTKYGITNQHTFVITDKDGAALAKWYGGSTGKIVRELGKLQ